MIDKPDLGSLYDEARSALKVKNFDRASDLLRQILLVDETYKDASRLLARAVKLKRRRWYSHPLFWSALGVVMVVALAFFITPRLRALSVDSRTQAVPTSSPTVTLALTMTIPPAEPLLPTATPIPLSWKRISLGQEFERDTVTAFATDKTDPDVIYAAMRNAGVYKTIDGGLAWFPAHRGLASTQVESLLIDSQNPQILYAGTMGGIFKTEDGGENWYRIGDGTYLLMDFQDNSHLYARDENGVYETTDEGTTWTTAYEPNKECPDTIKSWAIHPVDGKTLFIAGGGECEPGLYESNDGGRNWTFIGMKDKIDLDAFAIGLDEQGNYSIYAPCNHSLLFAADPDKPSIIYCGGDRLYVRQSWKDPWQPIPDTQSKAYTAIHIDHPDGTKRIIVAITDQSTNDPHVSIFISRDGGTSWAERANGISTAWSELKIDPIDNVRMFLSTYYVELFRDLDTSCTVYRSLDSGKNWLAIKTKVTWCGLTFDSANAFYLIESGALQMSSNGGRNWLWGDRSENLLVEEWDNFLLPNYYEGGSQSISANPYAKGLVYDIGNTIYYPTGSGWRRSIGSEGLSDARLFYTDQGKIIYAIGRTHQAYSTDNGKTWQSCGEDATASRSDSRLALDSQGLRLYLASPGQGVMVSTDGCQSWQASNKGLSNLFVNTLAIDPNNPDTIFAGTDGGAYISTNGGETWGQVNDGLLGATVVYSIVADSEGNVYAATPYGIFRLEGE